MNSKEYCGKCMSCLTETPWYCDIDVLEVPIQSKIKFIKMLKERNANFNLNDCLKIVKSLPAYALFCNLQQDSEEYLEIIGALTSMEIKHTVQIQDRYHEINIGFVPGPRAADE